MSGVESRTKKNYFYSSDFETLAFHKAFKAFFRAFYESQ